MRLFLLLFVLIYASMHFYAMAAASSAFNLKSDDKTVAALVMLILTVSPFIVRYSERTGHPSAAMAAAYIGYYWMGFLLYVVLSLLSFDLYRLILYLAGKVSRSELDFLRVKITTSFYLSVLFSICVCVYGYFEARAIRIEKVVIRTNKVTAPVKIAQISDVHVGLIIRDERIKTIVAAIAAELPDILVSTGDLVDGQLDNTTGFAKYFEALTPPLGKYAVTGNHEFYAGLRQPIDFTERCGFKLLRNEMVDIGDGIVIAGVDDPEVIRYRGPFNERINLDSKEALEASQTHQIEEQKLLMGIPPDKYTILLKHRPELNKHEEGLFDLQLSGHTHKGQIFPFNIVTWLYYSKQTGLSDFTAWVYVPNKSGLLKVGKRESLYVNRGAGTWGPPIRVLSPPEIAIIELIPENVKEPLKP
ncbi:MAG: metallophosphoesterase [Nitrospirae bacterium]|nr:metallophosphoesterase [Nitrospirota bacterium]